MDECGPAIRKRLSLTELNVILAVIVSPILGFMLFESESFLDFLEFAIEWAVGMGMVVCWLFICIAELTGQGRSDA